MPLVPGIRLGHYEILEFLGAGGMGEVYRALDDRLSRNVAIKILPPEFSMNSDRLKRFEGEARSASALNHPNIVTVHDVGTFDGNSYIAMEFIDGKTLRELLKAGSFPLKKTVQSACQIADGLARAHASGIIHRDLKPENIMITKDGFCKILDFGLAKTEALSTQQVSKLPTSAGTAPGIVLGTVGYMSPEQASGRSVDFTSDQFSFGSILYEMVTGKRAFERNTAAETLSAIINDDPQPITNFNSQTPAPLRWIVDRCMSKDPQDRYASTQDLARELQDVRNHFSELGASSTDQKVSIPTKGFFKTFRKAWTTISIPVVLLLLAAVVWQLYGTRQSFVREYHRMTYRKGIIWSARFAPDGQTVLYTARWQGGKPQLFQTRTEGVDSSSLNLNNAALLSVNSLGEMALLLRSENGAGTLAKMPITGGSPRELIENVSAADWSSDGKTFAIARGNHTTLEFPVGKKIYEAHDFIKQIRVSHNGNLIAIMEGFPFGSNGLVKILDSQGKLLAETPELWPENLVWNKDDSEVWFSSVSEETGGGFSLHALSTKNALRLINRYAGEVILEDILPSGEAIIKINDARYNSLGLFPGQTTEQEISWLDNSQVMDISDDGSFVLIWERGEGSEAPSGSAYVRKTDGSPATHIGAGAPKALSPDQRWALCDSGGQQIFMLPTGTGEKKILPRGNFERLGSGYFSPDGKKIVGGGKEKGKNARLFLQEISSGRIDPITPTEHDLEPPGPISPDGKFVLGFTNERWHKYFLTGSQPEELTSIQAADFPIGFTSDGHHIIAWQLPPDTLPIRVFKINLLSGSRELYKEILPSDPSGFSNMKSFVCTPDLKYYAYSYSRVLSTLYLTNEFR